MEFLEDVPDILHKYREWSNPYSKNLLFKRQLFFSSPRRFNDPFDGGILFQYDPKDLTEDKIFLKHYEVVKHTHPDLSKEEIHKICYEQQREGRYHDEKFLNEFQQQALEDINKRFGIVSLSKKPDNFLMWSYYGESHKGFAVGFEKKKLFRDTQCQFSHIIYQEDLPLLGLFDDVHTHFRKLIGTKSNIWSHEDEYRLTKINAADQVITLAPDTIAEVTCGCQMPLSEKNQIIEHIKKELPHARVFEMQKSKKSFTLDRIQIF